LCITQKKSPKKIIYKKSSPKKILITQKKKIFKKITQYFFLSDHPKKNNGWNAATLFILYFNEILFKNIFSFKIASYHDF